MKKILFRLYFTSLSSSLAIWTTPNSNHLLSFSTVPRTCRSNIPKRRRFSIKSKVPFFRNLRKKEAKRSERTGEKIWGSIRSIMREETTASEWERRLQWAPAEQRGRQSTGGMAPSLHPPSARSVLLPLQPWRVPLSFSCCSFHPVEGLINTISFGSSRQRFSFFSVVQPW